MSGTFVQSEIFGPRGQDLREKAMRWLEKYPQTYAVFVRFAQDLVIHGRPFGIQLLAERVRWEFFFERGSGDFKLNNSHLAYIARQLMEDVPGVRELMETRKVRC